MVTCKELQENPQAYANQQITLSGSVQTKQVLPQGVWLIFTDGTAYSWVWSSAKLDGDYTISGTVYETYLILNNYSQVEPPELGGNRLLKPLVISTSSLAYGFGLFSLTLSYPQAARSNLFYTLPVLSLVLGFVSWFALKKLDLVKEKLGLPATVGKVRGMWKLYPPLIISAFIALYFAPNVVEEKVTTEFIATIRGVFLISLAPIAISFGTQFVNTKKYAQETKTRLTISLISVGIIILPLLMLYPILVGTLN